MDPDQDTVNQQTLTKALEDGSLQLYSTMCEPGHAKEGAKGYILGNWNNYLAEFCEWLEGQDYVILWEDEWAFCSRCGGLVRTQPDCWDWEPFYVIHKGELLCGKCLMNDLPTYLESLESSDLGPTKAFRVRMKLDFAAHGYIKVNEGAITGPHPILLTDAVALSQKLKDAGIHRFLWCIPSSERAEMHLDLYIHKDIQDKLDLVRSLL